jgi:hypothetical protein
MKKFLEIDESRVRAKPHKIQQHRVSSEPTLRPIWVIDSSVRLVQWKNLPQPT